jgi:hypothetical protein
MNNTFIEKTDCTKCPCLNKDYENGADCNLGYETDLEWTRDKELIYCSDSCELISVKYKGGAYLPEDKKEVINLHPINWNTKVKLIN